MPDIAGKLKTQAKDSAEFRGHLMTKYYPMPNGARTPEWVRAVCLKCGRPVDVNVSMRAIRGTAAIVKCEGVKK